MKKSNFDIYEMINKEIIQLLEQGQIPWKMPWHKMGIHNPVSLITKKDYNGINSVLLMIQAMRKGYMSKYWATYKQIAAYCGNVRKGETGSICIFWKFVDKPYTETLPNGKTEEKAGYPVLRYYTVFNLDQVDNLDPSKIPADNKEEVNIIEETQKISLCESIYKNYKGGPEVEHRYQRAFYSQDKDYINMPKFTSFESPHEYYSTLFHELVHSTGHESRLNRLAKQDNYFGMHEYSKEELIAEVGSAYLCQFTQISSETIENAGAYIKGWLTQLKNNKKWLIQAFGKAQKAVDHILKEKGDHNA
jgi:antirestriction protein ArdC